MIPSMNALRLLAFSNIAIHLAAMAFAALGMRPGTPAVPVEERLAFLAGYPPGWILGWGAWMLCAIANVAFIAALAARAPERSGRAALAVTLAAVGAGVDLIFDTVHIVVLPLVAGQTPPAVPLFLAVERMAWAVGAVVANGLYSAATLLVTLELRGRIPRLAVLAGAGTFACGMLMCAAGFTGVARHLEIVAGPTIACFVVWTFTTARALDAGPRHQ